MEDPRTVSHFPPLPAPAPPNHHTRNQLTTLPSPPGPHLPEREIPQIIHLLTQSPPSLQRTTIERYFTPNASFTHPFCRTGSFQGSRHLITAIYRWYKILSPHTPLHVDSVAYDPDNLILYISLHQVFGLFFLPRVMYRPRRVDLTTVLRLSSPVPGLVYNTNNSGGEGEGGKQQARYFIKSQEDLYQVGEFVKFVSLFGGLAGLVVVAQLVATGLCVLGAWVGAPVSWVEENLLRPGEGGGRKMEEVGNGSA